MAGRWMMAAIQTSFAVMPALVYLFAGLAPGAASIGTIVAFTTLQTRLFFPVQSLLSVGVDIQTSTALFDRVFEYLDLPVDIEPGDADARRTSAARSTSTASGSATATSGRCATSTSPSRPARAPRWWVRPAPGKTSLGYLAARLYDPEQGAVRIDGADLRELTFDSLADTVGVVSQETYLFHASVRENLRFARPDATDAEIEDAARAAQIHETIAALPDGYDTVVGERGFRFSGGEKQRIAIARTILRNPPVLVLDEATARSTSPPSAPSATRWRSSPRAAPRSSSPTASRPSATPTRSSCSTTARSPSAAPTRSCSRWAASTPRSSPATKAQRRCAASAAVALDLRAALRALRRPAGLTVRVDRRRSCRPDPGRGRARRRRRGPRRGGP